MFCFFSFCIQFVHICFWWKTICIHFGNTLETFFAKISQAPHEVCRKKKVFSFFLPLTSSDSPHKKGTSEETDAFEVALFGRFPSFGTFPLLVLCFFCVLFLNLPKLCAGHTSLPQNRLQNQLCAAFCWQNLLFLFVFRYTVYRKRCFWVEIGDFFLRH